MIGSARHQHHPGRQFSEYVAIFFDSIDESRQNLSDVRARLGFKWEDAGGRNRG
jgi:hypothetical protein